MGTRESEISQNFSKLNLGDVGSEFSEFEALNTFSQIAVLPKITNNDIQPLSEKHVEPYMNTIEQAIEVLSAIFITRKIHEIPEATVVNIILFCGEHQDISLSVPESILNNRWVDEINALIDQSSLWKSENTKQKSNDILKIMAHLKGISVEELVNKYSKVCMQILYEKLNNQWLHFQAATNCFVWMLLNTRLSEQEDTVNNLYMNIILQIFEHHACENKLKALVCLLKFLNDLDLTKISTFFTGLPKRLISVLHHTELPVVIPTVVSIVKISLATSDAQNIDSDWSVLDDVIFAIIPIIEMGSTQVECVYMDALSVVIDAVKLVSVRWHFSLMQIIEKCIPNVSVYCSLLNLLQTYLMSVWPVVSNFGEQVCTLLLKMSANCDQSHKEQIYKCIQIIKEAEAESGNHEVFDTFINNVKARVQCEHMAELLMDSS